MIRNAIISSGVLSATHVIEKHLVDRGSNVDTVAFAWPRRASMNA